MPNQTTPEVFKNGPARVSELQVTDGGFALGNPGFAIDTNFDVQAVNAFDVVSGGQFATIAAGADFDTGTVEVLAADKWGAALLSIDADGTPYLQWTGVDWATEAEAIAGLDAITPTGEVVVGYVTVLTDSGNTWTAGTDALQGGTGGNPSDDTNYYSVFGWVK
jgi:hypothetical protein